MRTPVNRPGQGGADGPGVDAVGVVEGVPDMGVQAVGFLEELGRPPGVAVGDRGSREGVEGEGLGLEVALVARLVEHGVEVLDGGLGAGRGGDGGQPASGEQGARPPSDPPVARTRRLRT